MVANYHWSASASHRTEGVICDHNHAVNKVRQHHHAQHRAFEEQADSQTKCPTVLMDVLSSYCTRPTPHQYSVSGDQINHSIQQWTTSTRLCTKLPPSLSVLEKADPQTRLHRLTPTLISSPPLCHSLTFHLPALSYCTLYYSPFYRTLSVVLNPIICG